MIRGAEKQLERDMELATFAAHQTARMTYYGGKELKPLRKWLSEIRQPERRRQTAEEMVAAMRAIRETAGKVNDAG